MVRLGGKPLYQPSHLTSPVKIFFLLSSYFMYNSFSIYDENRLVLFVYFVSFHVFFLKLEPKRKKTNKNQTLRAKVGSFSWYVERPSGTCKDCWVQRMELSIYLVNELPPAAWLSVQIHVGNRPHSYDHLCSRFFEKLWQSSFPFKGNFIQTRALVLFTAQKWHQFLDLPSRLSLHSFRNASEKSF